MWPMSGRAPRQSRVRSVRALPWMRSQRNGAPPDLGSRGEPRPQIAVVPRRGGTSATGSRRIPPLYARGLAAFATAGAPAAPEHEAAWQPAGGTRCPSFAFHEERGPSSSTGRFVAPESPASPAPPPQCSGSTASSAGGSASPPSPTDSCRSGSVRSQPPGRTAARGGRLHRHHGLCRRGPRMERAPGSSCANMKWLSRR